MKTKLFWGVVCGGTLAALALSACGRDEKSGSQVENLGSQKTFQQEEFEANYISELGLAATEGFFTAKQGTFFKKALKQSSDLAGGEKCELTSGKKYTYSALGAADTKHRMVTLSEGIAGCGFVSGYVYEEHVTFATEKVFYAVPKAETLLKKTTGSAAQLPVSDKCEMESGRRYRLVGEPVLAPSSNHAKVTMAQKLEGCAFTSGYVFIDHFDRLLEGSAAGEKLPPTTPVPPVQNEFARTMKHILIWEGGCSDHPNDPGGRTFKGITAGRGRLNGWTRDICTMPDSMILEIYRKDYWVNRAQAYSWPLNLAIMNTEVNSGGGKAKDFLERMKAQNVQGSTVQKASWFVDQQSNFYRSIAANNPRLRVFLTGWLNRSAHMQDVIWGRRSLMSLFVQAEREEEVGTAKTSSVDE